MMLQSADFRSPIDVTLLLRSLTSDTRKPNLLVSCSDGFSEAVVGHLTRWCVRPFRSCAFPGSLRLPPDRSGTLLLTGVNRMTLAQQIALFDWTSLPGDGPQIVSLTTTGLGSLVMQGSFLEGLFHRLNVVQLEAA